MEHGLHPLDGEPLRPPAGWTPDPTFPKATQGDLEELGIALDSAANEAAAGEVSIHAAKSRVAVWVIPTNEELVVARLVQASLQGGQPKR